jgi:dimethylhistidine N-methyltransferase
MSAQPFALPRPHFRFTAADALEQFALDVRDGLTRSPKQLSPKYFYDEVGSALFDVITLLPEYGLSRADERLLRQNAEDIALRLASGVVVAELGSGSGRKTRPILQAICGLQRVVDYYAIDGSPSALERCRKELAGVPGARIQTLDCFYEEGIRQVVEQRLAGQHLDHQRLLVLFLGSSIGNFDRGEAADFLARIRSYLRPGDALLIGADLEKPVRTLLAAYDDPTGVTAAFNLNLLARINRELGADFVPNRFRHEARWCPSEHRIEMHLCSLEAQEVTIPASGITVAFEPGESIWSESSHKFTPAELNRMAKASGFLPEAQWIDREWPFAENLWLVQ